MSFCCAEIIDKVFIAFLTLSEKCILVIPFSNWMEYNHRDSIPFDHESNGLACSWYSKEKWQYLFWLWIKCTSVYVHVQKKSCHYVLIPFNSKVITNSLSNTPFYTDKNVFQNKKTHFN